MPKFPFTNYHELNLDWILKKVTALFDASEENAQTIRTYETRLTTAEQTATSAATAATAAQQLADAASSNADSALSVAGTANTKADSALTAATTAAGAAAGAMTTAQEARQIAGNAQSAAADAGAVANDASNAAAAAQQTADTNAGNIANLQTAVDTLSSAVLEIDNKADVIIDSASGSIASFADGANDMPIKSLVVNIEPIQAGSGDPSPTNIRPISGHNGAEVTRTGKNLLPSMSTDETTYGVTWHVNEDNSISVSGTATRNSVVDFGRGHLTLKPGTYTTNRANDGVVCAIWENSSPSQLIDGAGGTFVLTQDTPIFIRFYVPSGSTVNTTIYPQLELGSTVTDYEPYAGNQISITFPSSAGTVYGGTLTLNPDRTGTLVVDRKGVDLGTLNYNRSGAYFFADAPSDSIAPVGNGSAFICEMYPRYIGPLNNMPDFSAGLNNIAFSASKVFYAKDSRYSTAAEFKTAMNGIKLVYPLATLITYQFAPQQLNTLLGTNNIWADVGTVDVEYPADSKLYIDGKIAELQALVLEN